MSARKSTSKGYGGFDYCREDSDFISDNEQSMSSSEIFRLKVEAEKYKSRYNDAIKEIASLKNEVESLRERLGYIAAATNVLLPISSILPHSIQANLNSVNSSKRRSATPDSRNSISPTPKKQRIDEKPYLPKLEPKLVLEKIDLPPKRSRGRPPLNYSLEKKFTTTSNSPRSNTPKIETNVVKTPVFELDYKYPKITQEFLLNCHKIAETKVQKSSRASEDECKDRTFVRLIFHEIYEISELIGRSATGKIKRTGKRSVRKEIDKDKKQFIKEKLEERLLAIDPENIPIRSNQSRLNRWFSALVTNRVSQHKMAILPSEKTVAKAPEATTSTLALDDDEDAIYEVFDETDEEDEEQGYMQDEIKSEIVDYPKMSFYDNY